MSVKIMGLVWDADLPKDMKYLLLAYADHADHEGGSIFPSVALISWKTGYSERQVQRITKQLVSQKVLIPDGESAYYGTHQYRIDARKLPQRSALALQKRGRPKNNGDTMTPFSEKDKENGDIPAEKDDIPTENGDILANNGDIAMSPDPSSESSINPSKEPKDGISPDFFSRFLLQLEAQLGFENLPAFRAHFSGLKWGGRENGIVYLYASDPDECALLQGRYSTTIERFFGGFPELSGARVEFIPAVQPVTVG